MRLVILGVICLLCGVAYAADIQPLGQADAEDRAVQSSAERLERERALAAEAEAERKAEAERLAREEVERKTAKEEAARIEAQKAEAEGLAKEEAQGKAAEEAARIAAEKAETEQLAKIEAERKAAEEAERLAKEEADRKAAEAEAKRIAAEKAEAERLAAEKADQEEADRQAAEAEAARLAREEAERLAQEQAEREAAKAEAERIAAEKAEAEKLAAERVTQEETERQASETSGPESTGTEQEPASRTAAEETENAAEEPPAQAEQLAEESKPTEKEDETVAGAASSDTGGPGSGSTGRDGSGPSEETETATPNSGSSNNLASNGPITQQACSALGAPDHCPEVNAALALITEKPVRFERPSEMSFGDTANIDLAFLSDLRTGDLPGDVAASMKDLPEDAKLALSKLASTFSVKLTGEGFDVSPEKTQTLNADSGGLAGQNWQLTPGKDGGDQAVKAQLYATVPDGDGGTSEVLIKSFESIIKVRLSTWDWIRILFNAYLPYFFIIATLFVAIILLLITTRRIRQSEADREPADLAEGTGTAAALSVTETVRQSSGPVIGDLDQSASDGPAANAQTTETEPDATDETVAIAANDGSKEEAQTQQDAEPQLVEVSAQGTGTALKAENDDNVDAVQPPRAANDDDPNRA